MGLQRDAFRRKGIVLSLVNPRSDYPKEGIDIGAIQGGNFEEGHPVLKSQHLGFFGRDLSLAWAAIALAPNQRKDGLWIW